MSKRPILKTSRLRASAIKTGDFEALRGLHDDEKVMRSLSVDGRPMLESDTKDFLKSAAAHWGEHRFGIWALKHKSDGAFVGYCGLRRTELEDLGEVELLYALAASRWGDGLATEAARAVIDIAFSSLKLKTVAAWALPTNMASRRVMEKSAMRYERYITHSGLPHVLYRITALQHQMARQIKPSEQSKTG